MLYALYFSLYNSNIVTNNDVFIVCPVSPVTNRKQLKYPVL